MGTTLYSHAFNWFKEVWSSSSCDANSCEHDKQHRHSLLGRCSSQSQLFLQCTRGSADRDNYYYLSRLQFCGRNNRIVFSVCICFGANLIRPTVLVQLPVQLEPDHLLLSCLCEYVHCQYLRYTAGSVPVSMVAQTGYAWYFLAPTTG